MQIEYAANEIDRTIAKQVTTICGLYQQFKVWLGKSGFILDVCKCTLELFLCRRTNTYSQVEISFRRANTRRSDFFLIPSLTISCYVAHLPTVIIEYICVSLSLNPMTGCLWSCLSADNCHHPTHVLTPVSLHDVSFDKRWRIVWCKPDSQTQIDEHL